MEFELNIENCIKCFVFINITNISLQRLDDLNKIASVGLNV